MTRDIETSVLAPKETRMYFTDVAPSLKGRQVRYGAGFSELKFVMDERRLSVRGTFVLCKLITWTRKDPSWLKPRILFRVSESTYAPIRSMDPNRNCKDLFEMMTEAGLANKDPLIFDSAELSKIFAPAYAELEEHLTRLAAEVDAVNQQATIRAVGESKRA